MKNLYLVVTLIVALIGISLIVALVGVTLVCALRQGRAGEGGYDKTRHHRAGEDFYHDVRL